MGNLSHKLKDNKNICEHSFETLFPKLFENGLSDFLDFQVSNDQLQLIFTKLKLNKYVVRRF